MNAANLDSVTFKQTAPAHVPQEQEKPDLGIKEALSATTHVRQNTRDGWLVEYDMDEATLLDRVIRFAGTEQSETNKVALDRACNELLRRTAMLDPLINHCTKDGGECSTCGVIVCPFGDALHFHHDGCPSCWVVTESLKTPVSASAQCAEGGDRVEAPSDQDGNEKSRTAQSSQNSRSASIERLSAPATKEEQIKLGRCNYCGELCNEPVCIQCSQQTGEPGAELAATVPTQNAREQRFALIVAATGVKPEYLPQWCDEMEAKVQRLAELDYAYWTIKDPQGHLVHTCIATTKEGAIQEWIETEQAVNGVVNMLRLAKGDKAHCAQSWEAFEAEGYTLARVDLIEAPSVGAVTKSADGSPSFQTSGVLPIQKALDADSGETGGRA